MNFKMIHRIERGEICAGCQVEFSRTQQPGAYCAECYNALTPEQKPYAIQATPDFSEDHHDTSI